VNGDGEKTPAPASSELRQRSITDEAYREYEYPAGPTAERTITYRIDNPVLLVERPGGTTHRVVDAHGIVHCHPAPGYLGCALRWKPRDSSNPVQF
jgi:hypothetical protein